jgi:hypothetical protein
MLDNMLEAAVCDFQCLAESDEAFMRNCYLQMSIVFFRRCLRQVSGKHILLRGYARVALTYAETQTAKGQSSKSIMELRIIFLCNVDRLLHHEICTVDYIYARA